MSQTSEDPEPRETPSANDAPDASDDADEPAPTSEDPPPPSPPHAPRVSSTAVLAAIAIVTLLSAAALSYAFHKDRAGEWGMLVSILAVYLPSALLALHWMAKEGALRAEMRPRAGDLTIGAVVAAGMLGATMGAKQLLMPQGSPRLWWVARVYLQLGDLSERRALWMGAAVLVIAALEEITWRGLVMRGLKAKMSPTRAWLASSVLYAAAHGATPWLLDHPSAGPNPLLVAAALGCGLVWGHLANRTGRLVPSVFAHALFSWGIVEFPLWRP